MRLPLPLLLISISLLTLASCSDDGGPCSGEHCLAPSRDDGGPCVGEQCSTPSDDPDDACEQLRACCDQQLEMFDGEGGELYRTRCLNKLEELSRDASPSAGCQQAVDSLATWNYCLPPAQDSTPEANCDDLIDCARQVAADTLPTLLETYGPDGACWTSTDDIRQSCLDSCKKALDAYHDAGMCGSGDPDTDTYDFPDWLTYDDAVIQYCGREVMCAGGPDTPDDPVGLRKRECEDRVVRWISYGPPPCDEQVRAELACRVARGDCDTETWCGPEIDEACTQQPRSPAP
jgi:hypothetical protein